MTDVIASLGGKQVRYRQIVTAAGLMFDVPEHIVRMDDPDVRGWQLRYGEWTIYLDENGGRTDSGAALARAVAEMDFRLNTLGK